jgi:hypothetical protein
MTHNELVYMLHTWLWLLPLCFVFGAALGYLISVSIKE